MEVPRLLLRGPLDLHHSRRRSEATVRDMQPDQPGTKFKTSLPKLSTRCTTIWATF